MEIKLNINGLELEEATCFNCGEKIDLKHGELFVVLFDEGAEQTITDPGDEAKIYIECMGCYNER